MANTQRIIAHRRQYNQWVANQTMEDYALRFTASRARRASFSVANTALGAISFLACEAIGGTITLAYGSENAVAAILMACAAMFLFGLPVAYYCARYGVDIDLLTRGAGFGYLGSTLTSLVYASFTFLLFSFEASIMATALSACFGLPQGLADVLSVVAVVPIAAFGIRAISRMQLATQPVWLVLQLAPLIYLWFGSKGDLNAWSHFGNSGFSWVKSGTAASLLLSLLPQIGEQADYLRFLPTKEKGGRLGWWASLLATGPGWVVIGGLKLLAGSLLAVLALRHGVPAIQAAQPVQLYHVAFADLFGNRAALLLAGLFIAVCQMKINVTNAYAGSIAWSNFFSRLTHSHPGRVVWLLFNVALALVLIEIGIFRAITGVLGFYANFASAWIGALAGDLVISKPLGLSPKGIEFKRAHLYDINPVGVGAMALSAIVSTTLALGLCGPRAEAFAAFVGLLIAFISAPLIAAVTRGRTYMAREPAPLPAGNELRCIVCENPFERPDMAFCPAYGGVICSLCCTLDVRCHDQCKPGRRLQDIVSRWVDSLLPAAAAQFLRSRVGQFLLVFGLFACASAGLLTIIFVQYAGINAAAREAIRTTLEIVYLCLLLLAGIASWLLVLALDSRRIAEQETARQTDILMSEIAAHERTDAALQKAKEAAESANLAKSRYIVGLSHEIRTPLNSVLGYAQLMDRDSSMVTTDAVRVIRRSAEHMVHLVDGLLEISRVESGTLNLSHDRIRFAPFLEQIIDMFRLQAAEKGIGLIYDRPEFLPDWIHSDEKRLRQILLNLLSNAVKYTAAGSVRFKVQWRDQIARFDIIDTGLGIRPEDIKRIFEPFERGGNERARAQPGTGLGLTITKLFTEIMGGEIAVTSQPDRGSNFSVRLMLGEAMHPVQNDEFAIPLAYQGRRRTILMVDDDATHLHVMQQVLRPLDFIIFTAGNGSEALELAATTKLDLVLLDISMPGMNGWDVARELRSRGLEQLKIAMVSANVHEFRAITESDGPHDAIIGKPVDINRVLEEIANLLSLEWIYERPTATPPAAIHRRPAALTPHIRELLQLARIGYVRGIETRLAEIERDHPEATSFIDHLRGLLRGFQLRQFIELLGTISHDG